MPVLKSNPASSIGGTKKWKMYLMMVVAFCCWIAGAILSIVAMGFIAEIVYWMIWFFVYMDDIMKWIANPKVLGSFLASFALGSIPVVNFIPWEIITNVLIYKFLKKSS